MTPNDMIMKILMKNSQHDLSPQIQLPSKYVTENTMAVGRAGMAQRAAGLTVKGHFAPLTDNILLKSSTQ